MSIKEITNKEIWENFLSACAEKTFVNSWNWGEFQKKEGERVWRFGVFDGENQIASASVVKIEAKRGTFLFVPHGPNIRKQKTENKEQVLQVLLEKLKEIAKKEKAGFIRISPIWERTEENIAFFKDLGFRKAPIHMHPEVTWELDIAPSEDELLMGMRKTTRYLVRQAQKNSDIKITQSQDIKDLDIFNKIYQATAYRHHFFPFSLNYLQNQFSSFSPDNQISIFLGKYKGEIVSAAVIVFWQNSGFYHHGASLPKYNKIPVSYLLQWEAIKEAKRRGCQVYNFWGIAPEITQESQTSKSRHPWAGLSLFKMGFGGKRKEYVKTQDFPISPFYWLTYVFEKLRRIKRRL